MCLAVPGKIIAIADGVATVDYDVEKRFGKIIDGDYAVGDYVIISGGIVIDKIPQDEAQEALAAYALAVGGK